MRYAWVACLLGALLSTPELPKGTFVDLADNRLKDLKNAPPAAQQTQTAALTEPSLRSAKRGGMSEEVRGVTDSIRLVPEF
jgi:hypothetical protein